MMETQSTLNSGMCRCCSSEGTFKDIKTKYHWMGEEEVYLEMLTDCFDIKILTSEDTDNGICEVCITQLRNAVNFKKQVLHTEEQFKRRLQARDVKNPIKLESVEDQGESDHLSDPDFSGPEYDVPIKEEAEEKPKPKKRPAKATPARAKKPKAEPESSAQNFKHQASVTNIKNTLKPVSIIQMIALKQPLQPSIKQKKPVKPKKTNLLTVQKPATVMAQHKTNLEIVMICSNATPIRGYRGIGYACYFCPTEFPDPADLKKHTLQSHSNLKQDGRLWQRPNYVDFSVKLDITDLKCKKCSKTCCQLSDLLEHLQVEHDEPINDVKNYLLPFRFDSYPMKCVFCDADFNAFRMAIEHMNQHFRNHVCDVCDAGFVNKGSMLAHKRNHEIGDYQCKQCQQVYNTVISLKNHIRFVHKGIKRFKCGYCDEKFTRFAAKYDHLVKEHGVGPKEAKCKACDKTFGNYERLRVHHRHFHLQMKKMKAQMK